MKAQLKNKIALLDISIGTSDLFLRSQNYNVSHRSLHSSIHNWNNIVSFLRKFNPKTDFVIAKFTEYTLFLAAHPDYAKAFEKLITQLRQLQHVVYVYEANLSGKFSCETSIRKPRYRDQNYSDERIEDQIKDYVNRIYENRKKETFEDNSHSFYKDFSTDTPEPKSPKIETFFDEVDLNKLEDYEKHIYEKQIETALESFYKDFSTDTPESKSPKTETFLHYWCRSSKINDVSTALQEMATAVQRITSNLSVLPYCTLADIALGASAYVEARVRGLLLRIYVPKERIWSSEVARIVHLFQEYISSVRGYDVQIIEEHTEIGNIYSFLSKDNKTVSSDIVALFNDFATFLDICALDQNRAHALLKDTNLSPERAAKIISKYSKEARRLALDIRQEAELKLLTIRHQLEAELSDISLAEEITEQIASTLKSQSLTSNLLETASKPPNMQLTVNQNYIGTVNGIVSSQILGRVAYNEYDEQLLSLITQYSRSEMEKTVLQSALAELKDESLKKADRTGAWQKLRGFLAFIADKVGDVGVALLAKYLESYMPKPYG